MICKKCKTPLERKGGYFCGMFIDISICPKCDVHEDKQETTKNAKSKERNK